MATDAWPRAPLPITALVAQLAEQVTFNDEVPGSNPGGGTALPQVLVIPMRRLTSSSTACGSSGLDR